MELYYIFAVQLFIASISGVVTAQELDLNQLQSQLPDGITIPTELVNSTQALEDFKKLLKEKCVKEHGNEDAYKDIEDGFHELTECVQDIVNVSAIHTEIEAARPIGELDTVFHKYCLKRPDVLTCLENFNKKVKKCLDDDEQESNDTIMRIITGLLNFVCYKGGDQIALFIAEKGPECLDEQKDAIINCVNKTVAPYMPKEQGIPSLDSIPKLIIGPKECKQMTELKTCVVDALQGCQEITPANIVESMFKFIRNETSCKEPEGNNQMAVSPHFSIVLLGMLSVILSRILSL